jgi:WD40 repeat protein
MNKDRSLGRWDASSGKELMRYEPAHSNSIRALALSADGRHVVSAGPAGEIFLWDSKSGKRLHQLVAKQQYGIESMVYSLAFSPDGSRLAGGGPQNLVLWKVSSGEVERVFPSRSGGAIQIRFAKDGKKITTVHDFHGTESESGQDLLVYPTVGEWQLEEK